MKNAVNYWIKECQQLKKERIRDLEEKLYSVQVEKACLSNRVNIETAVLEAAQNNLNYSTYFNPCTLI